MRMIRIDSESVLKSLSYIEHELKRHTSKLIPSQRRKLRDNARKKQLLQQQVEFHQLQLLHEQAQLNLQLQQQQQQQSQQLPSLEQQNNKCEHSPCGQTTCAIAQQQPELSSPCESPRKDNQTVRETNNNNSTTIPTPNINHTQKCNPLKVYTSAAFCPKRPDKARALKYKLDCGEDAFFVCHSFPETDSENARVCSFGVADGVGGYALRGIDSSMLAWELMKLSKQYMERDHETTCLEAMTHAYDDILNKNLVPCGGSTACILSINRGKSQKMEDTVEKPTEVLKLTAANLGDSSFLVVRRGQIIYRSFEQTHFFNCPYQLTVPKIDSNPLQDDPTKSIVLDEPIDLIRGDVVILATDGLTDNVFDHSIANIVAQAQGGTEEDISAHIAREILLLAYKNSRSRIAETPFMKYADEHGHKFSGGKQDDITLIVALIA